MDELLNGTMADAVEALAKLAAYHRTGPAEKTAAPEWLTSLGESIKSNPALSHALIGGGVGAAALGANTARSNAGKDKSERKSILGSALTGGIVGAGAGGGLGLARQGFSGLKPHDGMSGTSAMSPGQFVDPVTGKTMQIDPKALKENPNLHAEIKKLSTPSFQSQLAGGVGGAVDYLDKNTPWSLRAVPAAMGLDAARYIPKFNLTGIAPETVGGHYGTKWLHIGSEASNIDDSLKKALRDNRAPGTYDGVTSETPAHRVKPGKGVRDILGEAASKGTGDEPVLRTSRVRMHPVEHTTYPHLTTNAAGLSIPDPSRPSKHTAHEPVPGAPPIEETLTRGTAGQLKGTGYQNDPHFAERPINRIPFTQRLYPGFRTYGGALGTRAAMYTAPFLAESVFRGLKEDSQNRETMREIMQRYAKPVPGGQ